MVQTHNVNIIKYSEYVNNKSDHIHKLLYTTALNKLFKDVNKLLNNETDNITIKTKVAKYISDELKKYGISEINENDFKIIEISSLNWYQPSNVLLIYTKEKITYIENNKSKSKLLKLKNINLTEYWNNSYLINSSNISDILLTDNYNSLTVDYIDFVNGTCILYDKYNDVRYNVDINYLTNDMYFTNNDDLLFSTKIY